ncbi:MAG: hypothetical protein AAGA96_13110, partial [Verrucomicrobiota bacterium]
ISTWGQNQITWGGIRYRVLGIDKTQILDRPVSFPTLPDTTPGLALIAGLHDKRRESYTQPILPPSPALEPAPAISEADDDSISAAKESEPTALPSEARVGPTSVGPFSDPRIARDSTSLVSSPPPIWRKAPAKPKRPAAASHLNPLLEKQSTPRAKLIAMTRYQPPIQPPSEIPSSTASSTAPTPTPDSSWGNSFTPARLKNPFPIKSKVRTTSSKRSRTPLTRVEKAQRRGRNGWIRS